MSFLKEIWPQCCQSLVQEAARMSPLGAAWLFLQWSMTLPTVGSFSVLAADHCGSVLQGSTFPTKMHLCIAFGCTSPGYNESKHYDQRSFQSPLKPWIRGVEQEPVWHDRSYPRKLHLGWLTHLLPPVTECSITSRTMRKLRKLFKFVLAHIQLLSCK